MINEKTNNNLYAFLKLDDFTYASLANGCITKSKTNNIIKNYNNKIPNIGLYLYNL